MLHRLRVASGKDKGMVIALDEGSVLTLGRSPSNDICINDNKISRIHCQIELAGDTCSLSDLNSTNGTFFQDERIDEASLGDGDSFRLGFTAIRFECYDDEVEEPVDESDEPSRSGSKPRIFVCNECGREVVESSLTSGAARQIGSGVYCAVCAAEFADVELVEDDAPLDLIPEPSSGAEDEGLPALGTDTRPSLDPLVGQTVAGIRVEEKIAHGPLGSLYEGVQLSMKREVALRILNRGPEMTDEVLEGILHAASAGGGLLHQNIVVVFDVGHEGNLYYVSMEIVDGESIRDILLRHKRLATQDAIHVASHVTRALRFALENDVIHGDVRPSNILINRRGTSKLSDFGVLPNAIFPRLRPARKLALLRYASPERISDREMTPAADIYSLGATLYHMICAKPPISADSMEGLRDQVLFGEIPPPSSLREELPPEADGLLLRMLAKDPNERHESPEELLVELKHVAKSLKHRGHE